MGYRELFKIHCSSLQQSEVFQRDICRNIHCSWGVDVQMPWNTDREWLMLVRSYNDKLVLAWMDEQTFAASTVPVLTAEAIIKMGADAFFNLIEITEQQPLSPSSVQLVQCLNHDVAGVMLINAMAQGGKYANLREVFNPVNGVVRVDMKINGHPVDFVKTVEDCWDRLNRHNDELAMKRAKAMITEAGLEGLDEITDMIRSLKGEIHSKLIEKFPAIHISNND